MSPRCSRGASRKTSFAGPLWMAKDTPRRSHQRQQTLLRLDTRSAFLTNSHVKLHQLLAPIYFHSPLGRQPLRIYPMKATHIQGSTFHQASGSSDTLTTGRGLGVSLRSLHTFASHIRLTRSFHTVASHFRFTRSPHTFASHVRFTWLPHTFALHGRLTHSLHTFALHGRFTSRH
jgi:hypothetical protein